MSDKRAHLDWPAGAALIGASSLVLWLLSAAVTLAPWHF
jgi:hypothetical protein